MLEKDFDYLTCISNGISAKAPETIKATVRSSLKELPENERVVLEMHFWEGLSLEQIAKSMRKKLGVIETIFEQALKNMKAIILENLGLEEVEETVELVEPEVLAVV